MKKSKIDELVATGYDFDIEKSFREGWEMFKSAPLQSMGYGAFVLFLQVAFALYINELAFVFSLFLAAPLYCGFFLVANRISRKEEIRYADFFSGFHYYVPLLLVWLVGQVLAGFGLFLFILPGIYLMVGYMFAVLIALFGGFDFWNSLEYSRKIIHIKWWKFFLLFLLLLLLNIIGGLLFMVGLMVTVPLTFYIIYCLFEEITQETLLD